MVCVEHLSHQDKNGRAWTLLLHSYRLIKFEISLSWKGCYLLILHFLYLSQYLTFWKYKKIPLLNSIGVSVYFQTVSGEGDVLLWQSPWLPRQSCTRPGFEPRWSCLGFCREISFFPFSVWLGDHVNGGLVELRLKPVSVSTWCILSSWRSLLYCRRITLRIAHRERCDSYCVTRQGVWFPLCTSDCLCLQLLLCVQYP